jgi:hypothetical protein
MRGARYDSDTELMDLYSSSTSWPRPDHGDHVQAILDMSEAYLHAAANCHEDRAAYSDRLDISQFCTSMNSKYVVRKSYVNVKSASSGVQRA